MNTQKTKLEKRNLDTKSFKKRYPRLYTSLIDCYGGRSNIFDLHAMICLFLRKEPLPKCEVCQKTIKITKKHRFPNYKKRCQKHTNTNTIDLDQLYQQAKNKGYKIISIPEHPSGSNYVDLYCDKHGRFIQKISNFLNGSKCQKCYHENRNPRITQNAWTEKCKEIHQNKYDYSESYFKGIEKEVIIKCPVHGDFTQQAGLHYRGHGCPKCAHEQNSENLLITKEEFIQRSKEKHGSKYDYSKVNYNHSRDYVVIICEKHGEFQQVAYYHMAGNGCPDCGFEQTPNYSKEEYEIIKFLKEQGIKKIEHSTRPFGIELDVYLPDYNLAIEHNGVFWHSSGSRETDPKASKQHLKKTELCEKNNISLLHILDIEWNNGIKKEVWKSTILDKINSTPHRIYARKCSIKPISKKRTDEFFEINHLQGKCSGNFNYGLFSENRLVAAISLSRPRFRNQNNAFEILRYASENYVNVIGGFSKLLKYFEQNNSGTIISYANRRWSAGNLYLKTNFVLTKTTGPCYYYTNCKQTWHRSVFQKHKLKDKIKFFDPNLSEVENMYANKYRRIWDCGNFVFEKEIK